jgi:hypothetical protein
MPTSSFRRQQNDQEEDFERLDHHEVGEPVQLGKGRAAGDSSFQAQMAHSRGFN